MTDSERIFVYHKYPLVPVKFYYKEKKTPVIDALLDSGGDFIVIPLAIAQYLGVKLEKAGSVDTAGGSAPLFKARVDMVIGKDDKDSTYKELQIHVSNRNDIPVLLGRYPIFEDYEIIFRKQKDQLIFKPAKNNNNKP